MTKSLNQSGYRLPAHIAFIQGLSGEIKYNLSDSTAQTMTLQKLCALDNAGLFDLPLSYGSLTGSDSLRRKIVSFHQKLNQTTSPKLNENNVLTFCGAQEALAAIYQAVLAPNDEVVVITPSYPSLVTMAQQQGCTVKEIEVSEEHSWQLSIEQFQQAINEKTKLIVVNSPHNPSGSIIDTLLAEQILALAQEFDCYLVADDVSQASNYQNLALSHNYLSYDKAIIVSVLSKSFGLAGIRVGWAVCRDTQLIQALLKNKCYGSICCSAIDLYLAEIALKHSETIIDKNNQIIKGNIKHVQRFIDNNSDLFSWHEPLAGLLAIVNCHFELPIEKFSQKLAEHSGILILPTSLFGLTGQYFRLGLGQANLCQTLEKLQLFINKYDSFIKMLKIK